MASALEMDIRRIVTDSDLDGVVTAAILRRNWPDAEIVFGHPGELRAGLLDGFIDPRTAVCDLPRHPECGLSIDHHLSNEPAEEDDGDSVVIWRPTPSAARIAFDLVSEKIDVSDLGELLHWVDKLDGGGISYDEYLSDNPFVLLGRVVDDGESTAMKILVSIQNGKDVGSILSDDSIANILKEKVEQRNIISEKIRSSLELVDRLAIVRFENLGIRSNGYHVTSMVGDGCDACIVIHGKVGASFGNEGEYPVSASFYTNSFLHRDGGIYDLTKLATNFDSDGGGHANACGCRIMPTRSDDGIVRGIDVEDNIATWRKMWGNRSSG